MNIAMNCVEVKVVLDGRFIWNEGYEYHKFFFNFDDSELFQDDFDIETILSRDMTKRFPYHYIEELTWKVL